MTDRWRWEGASTIFSFWTENTDPFVLDCDSLKEKQGAMYRERKERTEPDKVLQPTLSGLGFICIYRQTLSYTVYID